MNHLEELIYQYYEWQNYIVRRNIKVGRLAHGGYEGELDIVAYNPKTKHLIHIEPSIDGDSWKVRESRFRKKYEVGKKYIKTEVFPWLDEDQNVDFEQVAILVTARKNGELLAGSKIKSIDQLMQEIKKKIIEKGIMASNAIPEQYNLLRTIQMAICGYNKCLPS